MCVFQVKSLLFRSVCMCVSGEEFAVQICVCVFQMKSLLFRSVCMCVSSERLFQMKSLQFRSLCVFQVKDRFAVKTVGVASFAGSR